MITVTFHNQNEISDELLKFAVIAAKYHGKQIFCRNKQRTTWEIPGGHREYADDGIGENILDTAKRELYEETGATELEIKPVCVYGVTSEGQTTYGMLSCAEIKALGELPPEMEIGEIKQFDTLPSELTYPAIQPYLFEKVRNYMKDIFNQVEDNMNDLVDKHVWWSNCATQDQMENARNDKFELFLGISIPIPHEWILDIKSKDVLCLAGAGGLQAPLLAAAGANVTVIDISEKMLDKDRQMVKKYDVDMRIEHGNMTDLSRFPDASFDYIINPASLFYVPDVIPVFRECYRVLRHGGSLIIASSNPIAYVCDFVNDENGGYYKAVNRMPYCSTEHGDQGDWVEFGHTMQDYIGGQIACGFILSGYIEHQCDDITDLTFMTKADKL